MFRLMVSLSISSEQDVPPGSLSNHEVGTLWMGSDFARSVTDVNGRFHHVSNAHCVEQSIFPTAGSANPVLTGIALSRKIAESIIYRYTSVEFLANEPGFAPLYSGSLAADG